MDWSRPVQADPQVAQALAVVLALPPARARRFRRQVVRCHRGHTLAQTYQTAVGPVLIGRTAAVETFSEHEQSLTVGRDGALDVEPVDLERTRTRSRERTRLWALQQHCAASLAVMCRCSAVELPASWLAAHADDAVLVFDPSADRAEPASAPTLSSQDAADRLRAAVEGRPGGRTPSGR